MNIFDSIAVRSQPESVFDLSHEVKLSGNMGDLIPIYLEEIIPGDTFRVKSQVLMRLAPMLAPIMHKVSVYVHYFYVPNRLVWDSFHDHITGGDDGTANPAHPYLQMSTDRRPYFAKGRLPDYYGIPPMDQTATPTYVKQISALPFRGAAMIWNEYYRDQDLQDKIVYTTGNGVANASETDRLTQIRKRAWSKDYFTSARPTPQKGAAVVIPATGEVNYKAIALATQGTGTMSVIQGQQIAAGGTSTGIDNIDSVSVNTTVEDERRANRLQEWLELAQRGGSRINEVIRNFFGVTPDDLRLTRPQYLGGGVQPIVMSEVLNTAGGKSDTDSQQPLGEYGGHGMSVGASNEFTQRFKEFGYVHGFLSVIPKPAYQQGIHKHWSKFDKFEKYWPQFANIGEQEITNDEIFYNQADTTENQQATFGYAPRYSEYKYACDRVAGEMRKTPTADQLSYWHMGRYFENAPQLNAEFIEADPTHRIFAVTDETVDKLFIQIYHSVKAKRKMPFHNIPSNMPV